VAPWLAGRARQRYTVADNPCRELRRDEDGAPRGRAVEQECRRLRRRCSGSCRARIEGLKYYSVYRESPLAGPILPYTSIAGEGCAHKTHQGHLLSCLYVLRTYFFLIRSPASGKGPTRGVRARKRALHGGRGTTTRMARFSAPAGVSPQLQLHVLDGALVSLDVRLALHDVQHPRRPRVPPLEAHDLPLARLAPRRADPRLLIAQVISTRDLGASPRLAPPTRRLLALHLLVAVVVAVRPKAARERRVERQQSPAAPHPHAVLGRVADRNA